MSFQSARSRIATVCGIAVSFLVLGCGGGGGSYSTNPPPPPSDCSTAGTVCMTTSNSFSPAQVTVAPGGTVTWDNSTGTTHNVTFTTVGAPAAIGDFASGTRSATFPTAGTYAYHCTIHGLSMSGTVVVQ